ncbi:MAG: serine/threonine protein kinase, partial [Candidatus Eremiobacteraeota bacterium]|nr:serine/threonine protein kinase [Candidatus Eremiobacteraeota bacterium]
MLRDFVWLFLLICLSLPGGAEEVSFTVDVTGPAKEPATVLFLPEGSTSEQRIGKTGTQITLASENIPERFTLVVRPSPGEREFLLPYFQGGWRRENVGKSKFTPKLFPRRVSIGFDLFPEDTRIYREDFSSDKINDSKSRGSSENPLLVDRLDLQKPDGKLLPLKLRFERKGYDPVQLEINIDSEQNQDLKSADGDPTVGFSDRLKYKTSVTLDALGSPAARLQQFLYWHHYRPGLMFSLDAVLLAGLLAIPLWVLPARRQRERERMRLAVIDGYESKFSGEDPNLGKVLGAYRLVGRLGAGGMAVVYKAIPESELANGPEAAEKAAVAVKLMNQEYTEDPDFRRRFDREVQVCQELDHRNVVRLVDWGQESGALYMVMELVDGQTLGDILDDRKALEPQEFLTYMEGICQGLNHSHKKGIVHRDLKPSNIMVTKNGLIKIMDLGLAKGDRSDHKVTQTGDALGTLAYMPPEQFTGGVVTPYADQYSLGVMAYEMLT